MSYLNSVAAARAVVDSVIALHLMDLPLSPEWAIVGHSQGGVAAVASARWATEFSSETGLDYRGVVATGTPANIQDVVEQGGPAAPPPDAPRLGELIRQGGDSGFLRTSVREMIRTATLAVTFSIMSTISGRFFNLD